MIAALFKTETLSAISRDVAQVLFAGLFIEPIANGRFNLNFIAVGLLFSLAVWILSLVFAKA